MNATVSAAALDRPIAELAALVGRREVSPVELVREALARIERDNGLGAYITVRAKGALDDARRAEQQVPRGPLHGLPVALKDNIDTADVRTTCGSTSLAQRVPARDAVAWARLRRTGAILVGKTSLHEFAYAAPHPSFPVARNPHAPDHAAGGSSSGSAVAVAAGHVVAALGTDTGGSVRQPAAFCGVVGVKPTNDRIRLDGIFPLAPTLDCVGVLARDASDAALVLRELGISSRRRPTRRRVAVAVADIPVDPEIASALDALAGRAGAAGTVRLPDLPTLHRVHRTILRYEAYRVHHERLRAGADGYGPLLRAALEDGAAVSGAEYATACHERARAAGLVAAAMRDVDAVLLPAVPCVAPPLDAAAGRANSAHVLTRWTFLANLCGLPAVAFPVGRHHGLPIALQLIGRAGDELALLGLVASWTASV